MAYWAALRHDRKLDSQKKCMNPGCQKRIPESHTYCLLCALCGGQRKIRQG